MGVPSFYKWIFDHYNKFILSKLCPHGYGKTTHLYLDMNCGIHPAVKEKPMDVEEMPNAVIEYLIRIVKAVNPTELIYIAIDGVAPRAKMNQQRKRRYKVVKEQEIHNKLRRKHGLTVDDNKIDFNMISPGTKFICDVSNRLQEFIKTMTQSGGEWSNINVILSDASVPGEGEHKIMDHLRDNTTHSDNIVVYGLDSDLIFLCMANYRDDICLIREEVQFGINNGRNKGPVTKTDEYIYLSITGLRNRLLSILDPMTSVSDVDDLRIFKDKVAKYIDGYVEHVPFPNVSEKYKASSERLIADYLIICFFLGNDFLPSVPSSRIRYGGLDQVIRAYKINQMIMLDNDKYPYLTNDDLTFNQESLCGFLTLLSYIEGDSLRIQTISRHNRIKRFKSSIERDSSSPYERELLELDTVDLRSKDLNLGFDNWKTEYYQYFFGFKQHLNFSPTTKLIIKHVQQDRNIYMNQQNPIDKQDIWRIVKSYLICVKWTLMYYYRGCPDWEWEYSHRVAPCVSDIAEMLKHSGQKIDINKISFTSCHESRPNKPFEQLLMILPPQSVELIPNVLHNLMVDPDSPIIHFYPIETEYELAESRYLWECPIKLPKICSENIVNILKRYDRYLDVSESARNKEGEVISFPKDSRKN